ncbi:SPOSA6832_00615, partial [Sporobolomyces salmonicolor]
MTTPPASKAPPRLIDIGSNLSDPVFRGSYHGKQAHPSDFDDILSRARKAGVGIQLLTGDCLEGSKQVLDLAENRRGLYATVGCHPCRASEIDAYPGGVEAYIEALDKLIEEHKVGKGGGKGKAVAVGECGLDYDRLSLCPKDVQLKNFPPQLALASKHDLPLFLHSRAAHSDLVSLLRAHPQPLRGVAHSHSGTLDEALELIEMGFYIGINGCSLKTPENLDCVRHLPLRKLLLETDSPYCECRPSHASYAYLKALADDAEHAWLKALYLPAAVKKEKFVRGQAVRGRNEPSTTGQIAWIVAKLHGVSLEEIAEVTRRNTLELFGIAEEDGVWGGGEGTDEEGDGLRTSLGDGTDAPESSGG